MNLENKKGMWSRYFLKENQVYQFVKIINLSTSHTHEHDLSDLLP